MDRAKTAKSKGKAAAGRNGPAVQALLQHVGVAPSAEWNEMLAEQAAQALWLDGIPEDEVDSRVDATIAGLVGMAPKDEIEGMMAVQLIAAHNASLQAYRRAMDVNPSFNMWREAITQANSLSRTFSGLLDALHRYRDKGQKVTVEHVHVQPEGPANAASGGRIRQPAAARIIEAEAGVSGDSEEQPHAR